ncbi:putative acetylcholinesterase isoform X2 [Apostichopus japonicus]|uniref:Carboxylic ester hydrolase n=1 Tax=Stichopus japonicus TaxID=307972 RepID=A0A2G8L5S6_STIJA|nr:putative acetylcholinesterase isoform X2 [Apostichopus japonicus]
MNAIRYYLFAFGLTTNILASNAQSVTTSNGVVFGQAVAFNRSSPPLVDTSIHEFLGVPYAKPPIGDLRFRKPEAVDDWSEPWNATFFRPRCWQLAVERNGTDPQDEDCLYLNVWSPDVTRQNIPVMVWIHGGGFVEGASSDLNFDGKVLVAMNDVIMVSMNYRLNAFGFLATGDDELKGNYGLWDQNEALKWIKQNIAAFGGDPNNISLFGQSAGGASVGHHLIAQQSWDYFHRALLISGNMMSPWGLETDIAKARSDAFLLGRLIGCADGLTSAELVTCLRTKDAKEISAAANGVLLTTTNVIPTVPVIDGEFITADPRLLLANGNFKQCSVIVGIHCTSEHTSREYTTNGNTVYRYFFTHLPKTSYWPSAPRWIGVAHAEDLPFVFGYGFSPFREWEFTSDEEQLSLDIMRYFTNFAKTGDPNNSGDNDGNSDPESEWKEFEIPGLVLKEFNPNLNDLTGVRADHCRMWNHNIPSMVDYTDDLSEYEAQWREEITIWKYDDVTKWRLSFNDYQQNSDSCT